MSKIAPVSLSLLAALALTSAAHAAPSAPTGVWLDHTGRGAVEITECSGGLCGRIVWLKDPGHSSVCGKQVIGNAKLTGSGTWDGGWIYDPEKDARYSVELKPLGGDKLQVVGYLGSKFFSESFTWKRPTSELKRCDAAAAAPTPASLPSPPASNPKAAPSVVEKAEPAPAPQAKAPEAKVPEAAQPTEEAPPPGKAPKSAGPNFGDLEKIVREVVKVERRDVKGKPGKQECIARLPYVGNVTVPCPE
jgi:uncharacterized protein (DUF2147 family)